MDSRILFAIVVGLVIVAFGGFYFALRPSLPEAVVSPQQQAAAPSGAAAPTVTPAPPVAPAPIPPPTQSPAAEAPAALPSSPAPSSPLPPAPPPMATPASIEAEIAQSEHAELQALLKKNFGSDYDNLIAIAVRRRNEGASETAFGQEIADRFQDIMRGKLKFGINASMATIDKLAGNEASLFHALGTEGANFCMKILGKDDTPATGPQPESVRQLMRLGTLYRFQAIVEGMPNTRPVEALTADEMRSFEASLGREGLSFKDVSSGAYLSRGMTEPGRPCLTLETLHLAIARLPEGTRRKIYAGMFFLGRDR